MYAACAHMYTHTHTHTHIYKRKHSRREVTKQFQYQIRKLENVVRNLRR